MRTKNIGVRGQAAHLYKLGIFEILYSVFCNYMTVFSCYNKALTTFGQELLKLYRIPAIPCVYLDSGEEREREAVRIGVL